LACLAVGRRLTRKTLAVFPGVLIARRPYAGAKANTPRENTTFYLFVSTPRGKITRLQDRLLEEVMGPAPHTAFHASM